MKSRADQRKRISDLYLARLNSYVLNLLRLSQKNLDNKNDADQCNRWSWKFRIGMKRFNLQEEKISTTLAFTFKTSYLYYCGQPNLVM